MASIELPEWQREMLPKSRAALESGRFLDLRDCLDAHEWSRMEKVSLAQRSEGTREELLGAIHGAGAFRVLRNAIRQLGVEQSWFQFPEKALEETARNWLDANQPPYQ